ncbi:MAG TPA: tripartite tricarboxylate transporter substrate-binding protein [Burkholderiales bacterium]|nr:tripartite tricarboxylate transporter substrate-binding protein [Burkholderiales bacterium]
MLLACLMACAAGSVAWAADTYPTKPIRLVLNVGTGGVGDVSMRLAAQHMSRNLGQQIVVDNRPSAGGAAAAMAVVNAAPDGYTLLQTGNAAAISASLFKKLPYDVVRDFQQISSISFFELVVLATPESRFTRLADLIAYAQQNAGKLNIGTINVGSTQYLSAELLKSMAGIQAQVVPFKSNTLLLTALRGNELPVAFELVGPALTHIRSGALKALAVGSERRFGGLPDVPTVAEAGVPGFSVYSWTGMSAPARTPRPIIDRLAQEVAAAVAVPDVKQKLQDLGIEARAMTPDETRKMMMSDIAKWKAVIERSGIERQ